jgi:hypothetical protein
MQMVLAVWEQTTLEERQAYHKVMCQNSRDPKVLALVLPIIAKIQAGINAIRSTSEFYGGGSQN